MEDNFLSVWEMFWLVFIVIIVYIRLFIGYVDLIFL